MGNVNKKFIDSAFLCFQDMARLFFNYLRLSPNYWTVCNSPINLRVYKNMDSNQRLAIESFRRYGNVFDIDYSDWHFNKEKILVNDFHPMVNIYQGNESNKINSEDHFIHIPKGAEIPTVSQLKQMLMKLQPRNASDFLASKIKIRIKSLWKILDLVYTRALHPELEQWRIGALVKLVKDFGNDLDPWGPRSKKGVEEMRRHMNIIVKRWLDRGAVIAENAAHDLFPSDIGHINRQIQLDFGDQDYLTRLFRQGKIESDNARQRVLMA